MSGTLWFRQALRMTHLWTLPHRFLVKNSDFISQHPHKRHSWAVVQLPGWSHNTCKYEVNAARSQDYRELADPHPSARQGPATAGGKVLGGPSRPSFHYPLRHHLGCERLECYSCSHMHTDPVLFICPPHPMNLYG